MATDDKATTPEDITRLFVDRANAQDIDGLVDLYEEDAVMAFPPGQETRGHNQIRALLERMLESAPTFEYEEPIATLYFGDLAMTGTPSKDNTGTRIQIVRKQDDGSWRRIIDRPEDR